MSDPNPDLQIISLDPSEVEAVRLALDTIIEQALEAKRFLDEREFTKVGVIAGIIHHNAMVTDACLRDKIKPAAAFKVLSDLFGRMADEAGEEGDDGDTGPPEPTDADVKDLLDGIGKLLGGEDTPGAEQ